MKRMIAITVFWVLIILSICVIANSLLIEPCIEVYLKYGLAGLAIYIQSLVVILCIIHILMKLMDWCIENYNN